MRTADFEYMLPEELIAQEPAKVRDESRLMVLDRQKKTIHDTVFKNLHSFLEEGDILVINDTSVIPARLVGVKEETGAKIEIFLLRQREGNSWEALMKPSRKVKIGGKINFSGGKLSAIPEEKVTDGKWIVGFECSGDFYSILQEVGKVPLPPYIRREALKEDRERYQTVYAKALVHDKKPGAVAAPTAGLHFTKGLLQLLREKGIKVVNVTLSTGAGTFRPIKEETVEEHPMDSEFYEISESACFSINEREQNKRVVAVGTTTTRLLETVSDEDGKLKAVCGWTDLFIHPGYRFKIVNSLITNFHPSRSTTFVLTSAFCGMEFLLKAYQLAIEKKYRFFSYGDAMLIL